MPMICLLTSMVLGADLAPLYQQLCAEFGWSEDAERLQAMQSKNEAQLKELEDKITDADENLGDVEVRDAFLARADHLCRLGAWCFRIIHSGMLLSLASVGPTLHQD